jgi:hypothetical protein
VPSEPEDTVRLAWKLMVVAISTTITSPTTAAQAAPEPAATNRENGTVANATLGAAAASPWANTPHGPSASCSRPVDSAVVSVRPSTSTISPSPGFDVVDTTPAFPAAPRGRAARPVCP